jgi:GNAT superfamily N-acetyltransferase
MVLQGGREWPEDPLSERLDAAYYALTRTTSRHFSQPGRGWFLTGVAGLDAPTMNRCVVEDAHLADVERMLHESAAFFGERECQWSVVLPTFRDTARWHSELVMRGLSPTTALDVMVREPGPLRGAAPDPRVREARPDETPVFTEVLMEVFRMPRRFYPALLDMTQAWRDHGARLYLGELEGEVVSTTLLATLDGVAGVYNVGTLRRARRQGLARGMMARALEDARDADLVTLQVAPDGFTERFYLDLGFLPRYTWRFYSPRSRLSFLGR